MFIRCGLSVKFRLWQQQMWLCLQSRIYWNHNFEICAAEGAININCYFLGCHTWSCFILDVLNSMLLTGHFFMFHFTHIRWSINSIRSTECIDWGYLSCRHRLVIRPLQIRYSISIDMRIKFPDNLFYIKYPFNLSLFRVYMCSRKSIKMRFADADKSEVKTSNEPYGYSVFACFLNA